MSVDARKFFSIVSHADGSHEIDKNRLKDVMSRYGEMTIGKDPQNFQVQEESINELIKYFELNDDKVARICISACVTQTSEQNAAWDIEGTLDTEFPASHQPVQEKARAFEAAVASTVTWEPPKTTTTTKMETNTTTTTTASNNDRTTRLKKIICVIHQKSDKKEVNDFFSDFLFRLVPVSRGLNSRQGEIHPYIDGKTHLLERGTILELFIRQQLADRGSVTLAAGIKRCRLVDPITRTDEFDTWRFDHFHGLMDFWLTMDDQCQTDLPTRWALDDDAEIEYLITKKMLTGEKDSKAAQSDRPNTKSLRNFIEDVCRIEGNQKGDEWYKTLVDQESITEYSNLTNLNAREWERMTKMPMNAAKTIKFYIDQEKQMVEERKKKKSTEETGGTDQYSKAEIRANLHMIQLFINRQLESFDDIEVLPLVNSFCVERAFEEMVEDGFEDDDLFPQMKLFFQALTVADQDLHINKNVLTGAELKELKEKEDLQKELPNLIEECQTAENEIQIKTSKVNKKKEEKVKIREDYEKIKNDPKIEPLEKAKAQRDWAKRNGELAKEIDELTKSREGSEQMFYRLQNQRKNMELRLASIQENFVKNRTRINRRFVKPHRGFIMYGPPGTGKSVIMSQVAKKIGIAMVGPALAAGELERPYVGQSEAIILDLCMRANRLPHLMCCLSIDEIDSLAPRRDDDSSEGKVAKISVLLSVIEGIKDVPNLMFFSATNRLHMMDEAFLRRMSGKFFVGRPSAEARTRILNQIPKIILQAHVLEQLGTATTNFSGAALKALNSAITVEYIAERRKKVNYQMPLDKALQLADRTAQQFQLFLGLDTLPRLLLYNLNDRRRFAVPQTPSGTRLSEPLSSRFFLPTGYSFTGKVIFNLKRRCARFETINDQNESETIEEDLNGNEQSLQQLLERIACYGSERNVQLLQLIDLNLLSSKGAHEEKKIFETLKERYDECMQYRRSMIVYDVDSLIGVNKSESESSMGTSVSSSVVNEGVYIYVSSRFREAKIEAPRSDGQLTMERWAVAVVRDQFLFNKFTADVDFPLTTKQIQEEEKNESRSKDLLYCCKCRDQFTETENKMGACTYHDGFLYDNISPGYRMYSPSQVIDILNREERIAASDPKQKEKIDREKTRFKYICCYATFQVGAGSNGCKKGEHGGDKDEDGWQKERIDARHYFQIKTAQDQWEKACLDDIGYNQKLQDVITPSRR